MSSLASLLARSSRWALSPVYTHWPNTCIVRTSRCASGLSIDGSIIFVPLRIVEAQPQHQSAKLYRGDRRASVTCDWTDMDLLETTKSPP